MLFSLFSYLVFLLSIILAYQQLRFHFVSPSKINININYDTPRPLMLLIRLFLSLSLPFCCSLSLLLLLCSSFSSLCCSIVRLLHHTAALLLVLLLVDDHVTSRSWSGHHLLWDLTQRSDSVIALRLASACASCISSSSCTTSCRIASSFAAVGICTILCCRLILRDLSKQERISNLIPMSNIFERSTRSGVYSYLHDYLIASKSYSYIPIQLCLFLVFSYRCAHFE